MSKSVPRRAPWSLHPGVLLLAACMCMFAITSAYAQVFRCTDPDGHAVFSDTPCGSAAEQVEVADSSAGLTPASSDGLSPDERNAVEADAAERNRVDHEQAPDPVGDSYVGTAAAAKRRSY